MTRSAVDIKISFSSEPRLPKNSSIYGGKREQTLTVMLFRDEPRTETLGSRVATEERKRNPRGSEAFVAERDTDYDTAQLDKDMSGSC